MSYQEKRIKSGLAVTAAHLKLCDDNLRRADTASRNEFVEKAIEFYAGYLNAAQNPHFFDEMFTSEAQKKVETLSRTMGTGQYKITVELAKLSRLGWVTMQQLVLEDIRRNAKAAKLAKQQYKCEQQRRETEKSRKELKSVRKRMAELEKILNKLYEDLALERITESRYQAMVPRYEAEQDELGQRKRRCRRL